MDPEHEALAMLSLDALRPRDPGPPGPLRRAARRVAIVLGWAVGARRVPHLDRSLQAVFPWALSLAIAIPLAWLFDGAVRLVLAGGAAGLVLAGAVSATQQRAASRRAASRLVTREADLLRLAEDRAASVARQFGWAVDDLLQARRTIRERDGRIAALQAEIAAARGAVAEREREVAAARQKVFEVGLFDVDRERARVAELTRAADELRAAVARAEEENAGLRADAAAATRRAAELAATLRRINEVTQGAATRPVDPDPLAFRWKLEFDGRVDLLRLQAVDPELAATSARLYDGDALIAQQHEAASADAVLDHDRAAGWQSLVLPEGIAERFRRAAFEGLRFELQVEGSWLVAVPETTVAPAPEKRARVWAIDARRSGRRAG
jgi:hypothetical protein